MEEELTLLRNMGTWKLTNAPADAVPIPNKWTFVQKQNKQGEVIRHRARLVAKGCAQCPGHDYIETFSSVVQMDTMHVILALVPTLKLKIHQVDVKGAYLNGILKEQIYIRQNTSDMLTSKDDIWPQTIWQGMEPSVRFKTTVTWIPTFDLRPMHVCLMGQ